MSAPQLTTQMASVPPLPLLLADRDAPVIASEVVIEVDEFDIWSSSHSALPKFRKPVSSSRLAKKPSKRGESGDRSTVMVSSLPVNIPDWSKILREDYRDKNRKERAANSSDAKTMSFQFAGRAVYIAIWVAAISLFMELLGFSTQKWLTTGGLGTVLLTLVGRKIFTNLLSSVMIHATRPFVVNEWIQTKIEGYEVSGTVEVCIYSFSQKF